MLKSECHVAFAKTNVRYTKIVAKLIDLMININKTEVKTLIIEEMAKDGQD